MRKTAIRFSFVVLAVLAIMTFSANAQAPDFGKVQIKTNKISNNFYTLDGQGGTIGLLVGRDGVFMVDDRFAPLWSSVGDSCTCLIIQGRGSGHEDTLVKLMRVLCLRDRSVLRARSEHACFNDAY